MAQVVERYFREVEAASSSLVTPTAEYPQMLDIVFVGFFMQRIRIVWRKFTAKAANENSSFAWKFLLDNLDCNNCIMLLKEPDKIWWRIAV